MSYDFGKAYRVNALSLGDKIGVFQGEVDPREIDTASFPVGSMYFQTDGTVWKRSGADASAWVKLVAEDMMLLNLGMAVGSDGWAHTLNMAGPREQELMTHDAGVIDLLRELLAEQKKTNIYLSLITDENLDTFSGES